MHVEEGLSDGPPTYGLAACAFASVEGSVSHLGGVVSTRVVQLAK